MYLCRICCLTLTLLCTGQSNTDRILKIIKNFVHQVGHRLRLYDNARSAKHQKMEQENQDIYNSVLIETKP